MENVQLPENCLFCKIAKREEPAEILHENDKFIVVKNKYPNAPIHLLIIAKEHLVKQSTLRDSFDIWKDFFETQADVVNKLNLWDKYQLVVNAPGRAHFHHEHMHLIAGKDIFEK